MAASRNGSSWPKPPALSRDEVIPCTGVLPGVIFAVDAYLALVRDSPLLIAVASSLTELFSRDLISLRMDQLRIHYPYLVPGLAYFEGRLTQAPEDAAFALDYVSTHAKTRAEQEQVIRRAGAQVRDPLGAARRHRLRLCAAGQHPAGMLCSQAEPADMDINAIPRLAPGCRLHPTEAVLLVPEGTLNLSGPARDILRAARWQAERRGDHRPLLEQYSGAPKDEMTQDVLNLLDRMEQRGVVRA